MAIVLLLIPMHWSGSLLGIKLTPAIVYLSGYALVMVVGLLLAPLQVP